MPLSRHDRTVSHARRPSLGLVAGLTGADLAAPSGCRIHTGEAHMRIGLVLFILFLLIIGGGAVFLMTYDIPAPAEQIEKVIPNDRFAR